MIIMSLAATAGKPIPGKVKYPLQNKPPTGVVGLGNHAFSLEFKTMRYPIPLWKMFVSCLNQSNIPLLKLN